MSSTTISSTDAISSTTATQTQKGRPIQTKKVLIVGAGPAGILAAILFLRRNSNDKNNAIRYQVTLVDPGVDHGKLDGDDLKKKRSWMIGLSAHGLAAIRTVPGLFEKYVHKLGVETQHVKFGFTSTWLVDFDGKDFLPENSTFSVDRNYICAALARYLNDHFLNDDVDVDGGGEKDFVSHYKTKALFVDGENRSVICRSRRSDGSTADFTLDYDLLLGCDGIRSVVRNAFLTTHREFAFDTRDTFGCSKSTHLALPKDGSVNDCTFMILLNSIPNVTSFVLPETNQMINVNFGFQGDVVIAPELESKDASVVSTYLRQHFKAFPLDFDEAGKQWVAQGWQTIGQVHCSFYHSHALSALLLGDAAHATSPVIGQGMNTALADAVALDELLDRHGDDDLAAVLPAFSTARVREGHALTDLSFYTYSYSGSQQLRLMLRQQLRNLLHRKLPWLVRSGWPMDDIPAGGKMSVAYDKMVRNGVLGSVRRVNDDIIRQHFERKIGLVNTIITPVRPWRIVLVAVASAAVFCMFGAQGIK